MKKDNRQRLFEMMERVNPDFLPPLDEAQAVPFSLDKKMYPDINSYNYSFIVDGHKMKCDIWHDNNKHLDGVYEVAFGEKHMGDYHRIGKDLKFMNTVLETVAGCVRDFLGRETNVAKLKMEGAVGEGESAEPWVATTRTKAYLRFIKNKFPEYKVQDFGRYIEITIREKVENEMERMKDVVRQVSDVEAIPDYQLQGNFNGNKMWSFETDAGINSKVGQFLIEVTNDLGNYDVKIEVFDNEEFEPVNQSFRSFNEAKNFILNYFQ